GQFQLLFSFPVTIDFPAEPTIQILFIFLGTAEQQTDPADVQHFFGPLAGGLQPLFQLIFQSRPQTQCDPLLQLVTVLLFYDEFASPSTGNPISWQEKSPFAGQKC